MFLIFFMFTGCLEATSSEDRLNTCYKVLAIQFISCQTPKYD